MGHVITHKRSATSARNTTETRAWEASPRPQDAPGMCHPAPLRTPPGRPPSRPAAAAAAAAAAARRMLTEGWVWSPPRPAADSRQGPDPGSPPCSPPAAPPQPPTIPARLCLQAASPRSYSQMLPRGRPAAGPGRTGFQAARTGPFCWRSRRPGGA